MPRELTPIELAARDQAQAILDAARISMTARGYTAVSLVWKDHLESFGLPCIKQPSGLGGLGRKTTPEERARPEAHLSFGCYTHGIVAALVNAAGNLSAASLRNHALRRDALLRRIGKLSLDQRAAAESLWRLGLKMSEAIAVAAGEQEPRAHTERS